MRRRKNSDAGMRDLERHAGSGDRDSQVNLLREQIRRGLVSKEEVDRMIEGCDAIALEATGRECGDMQLLLAAGKKNRLTGDQAEEVLRAYYAALGYERDARSSSGNLISRDGQAKVVFTKATVQVHRGGRGRWRKYSSQSKKGTAEELIAYARQRAEGGKATEKHKARKKKEAAKRVSKKAASETLQLQLRLAVVQIASTLSPGDRATIMVDAKAHGDYVREVLQRASVAVVHPEDDEEAIDSLLSLREPPIPLPPDEYSFGVHRRVKYNGQHAWVDKGLKKPVRVWCYNKHQLGVEVGSMPVDPLTTRVSSLSMARSLFGDDSGPGDGFAGSLRAAKNGLVAFLLIIISAQPRSGWGTRYVRAWCRLIESYGAQPVWVAQGVGDQGVAFLSELEQRGELELEGHRGKADILVRCHRALDDPHQGWLFRPASRNPMKRKDAEKLDPVTMARMSAVELGMDPMTAEDLIVHPSGDPEHTWADQAVVIFDSPAIQGLGGWGWVHELNKLVKIHPRLKLGFAGGYEGRFVARDTATIRRGVRGKRPTGLTNPWSREANPGMEDFDFFDVEDTGPGPMDLAHEAHARLMALEPGAAVSVGGQRFVVTNAGGVVVAVKAGTRGRKYYILAVEGRDGSVSARQGLGGTADVDMSAPPEAYGPLLVQ